MIYNFFYYCTVNEGLGSSIVLVGIRKELKLTFGSNNSFRNKH